MMYAIPFPDISPDLFAIDIGGFTLALRWYALAYIVGIVAGWRLAVMAVKRPHLWRGNVAPLQPGDIEDLITNVILGIIIGGRLGFVLFYQPSYYLSNPLEIPMIWQGGMSFHGGMLGVALGGALFAWRKGVSLLVIGDLMALGTPIGLMLGRIANFINAELWGRPTDAPWGVIFPGPRAQDCPGIDGLCARHPSQLYEAGLEGLVLGAILIALVFGARWLKTPGAVMGVFLAGYGLARSFVELFRQADAQFITPTNPWGYVWQIGDWGLSMGQILSLPMILIGLGLIIRARHSR
ncbi:prolipoprotein diacylglyceryl transferase [Oceaniglobus ichthyenteri]|uniref:prolipoprotein diacylglyceryl transferase n=1 Tax=Oceaniglobus ichthyenteri TaxID=2136177 RepID=UPI000D3618F3|nr:prolipoprotein diacylglyceryl transferase [Oceaniglobus ichthyenteri]